MYKHMRWKIILSGIDILSHVVYLSNNTIQNRFDDIILIRGVYFGQLAWALSISPVIVCRDQGPAMTNTLTLCTTLINQLLTELLTYCITRCKNNTRRSLINRTIANKQTEQTNKLRSNAVDPRVKDNPVCGGLDRIRWQSRAYRSSGAQWQRDRARSQAITEGPR